MVTPAVGAVILIRFPFSDLRDSKLRPAVVLADAGRGDLVLCQITSQKYADAAAVEITHDDFATGSLQTTSHARTAKLFTANSGIIRKKIGDLKDAKLNEIIHAVVSLPEQGIAMSG